MGVGNPEYPVVFKVEYPSYEDAYLVLLNKDGEYGIRWELEGTLYCGSTEYWMTLERLTYVVALAHSTDDHMKKVIAFIRTLVSEEQWALAILSTL